MPVYFIRNQNGNVKIGHSTNPAKRLMLLQTGTAESLSMVRTIEGDDATERWLHKHFASDRIRGEWFDFREEMLTICPPDLPSSVATAMRAWVWVEGGRWHEQTRTIDNRRHARPPQTQSHQT